METQNKTEWVDPIWGNPGSSESVYDRKTDSWVVPDSVIQKYMKCFRVLDFISCANAEAKLLGLNLNQYLVLLKDRPKATNLQWADRIELIGLANTYFARNVKEDPEFGIMTH